MNANHARAEREFPAGADGSAACPEAMPARAFLTAHTHHDAGTRERAGHRVDRWRAVLTGMADGTLTIGSRTPVAGLPAWVTPEVVRGGFVTSEPSAGGPLQPYEHELASHAGVPAERRALFTYCLTEAGLARLYGLLDSGRYEITVPEEGALLTVAWLVRAQDTAGALGLVETLAPFADRLRFTPRPAALPAPTARAVHRRTVAEARATLARRRPNTAIETQREALTVWQPFADELLTHWLETAGPGPVADRAPDEAWRERGAALLRRYRELAAAHTLCTAHRDPKGNAGILRGALEETVAGRPLTPRRLGLLRHAVESMVRKRGRPGSAGHTELRAQQAAQAARPSHHAFAQLVLHRLSALAQHAGAADTAPLVTAVSPDEARHTALPAGAAVPAPLRTVVENALSAPLATLVERGVVTSAEVLAELVPQLVAATGAQSYRDEALRTLMAAHYRAFRNRRSLLLLDLARQVRADELPWVRATAAYRTGDGRHPARTALCELGELAVQAFPGTLLPNPLIRELGVLARQAETDAPFVEELAVDIFMGTFTPKFLAAAGVAAGLLEGTLYERYYGIDYAAVRDLAATRAGGARTRTAPDFAKLCTERAGQIPGSRSSSLAASGGVIEQAQILTTHNLATLVSRVGIRPEPGWEHLAGVCFRTVCKVTARVHGNPRPLAMIKDAAYAWRQMIFHLSLCAPAAQARAISRLDEDAARHPGHVSARLAPALTGLRQTVAGGVPDTGEGRLLLGWSTQRHWLRPARPA
ncbi:MULTISPECIES: hypothetical protein [unclassified Streptomyces]|uniref:hypothetical protein n=1 Tax=unclassified Streptomyces TaxID=2593676 RepID=UPI000363481C|nr:MULTISPECIES: hypothetical protein [unclassified Streptomyces]MYY04471.1 hypothetical protein [Streptomyces sp. SID4913]